MYKHNQDTYRKTEVNLYKSQYQKYLFGRSGILFALLFFASCQICLETCHVPVSPGEPIKKQHSSC